MIPSHLIAPSPSSIPPSPSSYKNSSTSNFPSTSTTTNSTTINESPLSITKSFRPYYSPIELNQLIKLQASAKNFGDKSRNELSEIRIEIMRQLACGFIERVGGRLGFPRRTTATAQTLYHRFHLHFHLREFAYQDVSISALLVASKLEDTLKKLREIQNAALQVNDLLEGKPGTGEGDTVAQEAARPQLIAIERLILQTICFNFNLHKSITISKPESTLNEIIFPQEEVIGGKDVFGWVIRLGRSMKASKQYTFLAHLLAIDVHRTLALLSYPPHTVALACLYLASFLIPIHKNSLEWRGEEVTKEVEGIEPIFIEGWCSDYESIEEDVEEIAHSILNLFIQLCPLPTSSSITTKPSPTYSPSSSTGISTIPSPSDPIFQLNQSRSNNNNNSTSNNLNPEKVLQLFQSGIPNTLSNQWKDNNNGNGNGNGIIAKGVEEFTKIKIALRGVEIKRIEKKEMRKSFASPMKKIGKGNLNKGKEKGKGKGKKREIEEDDNEENEINFRNQDDEIEKKRGRVERWKGGEEGFNEVSKKIEKLERGEAEERKPISVRYQF